MFLFFAHRHMAQHRRRPPRERGARPQGSHEGDDGHVHGMETRAVALRGKRRRCDVEYHPVGRLIGITPVRKSGVA